MVNYRGSKCKYKGIEFDSHLELDFYMWATMQNKTVKRVDKPYIIQDKFKYNGKWISAITYEPDFIVNGIVIEVKPSKKNLSGKFLPFMNAVASLKIKMFKFKFPDVRFYIAYKDNKNWVFKG